MRPPRCLCLTTFTLVLLQATGCYSHRPIPNPRPGAHEAVRVTTTDGEVVELAQAQIDSLTIRGDATGGEMSQRVVTIGGIPTTVRQWRPGRIEIPLGKVAMIEERHLNMLKTVGCVALASVGVLGGVVMIALSNYQG